jgi:hypothetical protein
MKKSAHVPAILVASLAASILSGGCSSGPREVRRCVDDKGVVLSDAECEKLENRTGSGGYVGGYRGYPHWVYGGSGGNTPGSRAMGFRSTPTEGAHVVSPSGRTISRGGFGGSSRGGGGFGG